jgi:hypothetical protein
MRVLLVLKVPRLRPKVPVVAVSVVDCWMLSVLKDNIVSMRQKIGAVPRVKRAYVSVLKIRTIAHA